MRSLECPDEFRKINSLSPHQATQRECPDEFRCPISMEIMKDPVLCEDGNTYERENIIRWLDTSPVSPMTRQPMNKLNIRPNYALKSLIQSMNKPPPKPSAPKPSAPKPSAPKPSAPPMTTYGGVNTASTDYYIVVPPQLTTAVRPVQPSPTIVDYTSAGELRIQQRRKIRNLCTILGLILILILVISIIRNTN